MRMGSAFSKKAITIGGISIMVVLFLAAYLFLVPTLRTNRYEKTLKAQQPELRSRVEKVGEFFKSDTYTDPYTLPEDAAKEYPKVRERLKALEEKLAESKKALSNFTALPLMASTNSKYKTARDIQNKEARYIADAEKYAKDVKETLDFLEKENELTKDLSGIDLITDSINPYQTLPEFGIELEKSIVKVRTAVEQYSKLKPPADYKPVFDDSIATSNKLIKIMEKVVTTAKANDEAQLFAATLELQFAVVHELSTSEDLYRTYATESAIAKADRSLKEQGSKLATSIAKL